MVESASQTLQNLSSNHADLGWHGTHADEVVDKPSRLRIMLGADYIRVGSEEGPESRIQLSEVKLGTADLGLHAFEPITHG